MKAEFTILGCGNSSGVPSAGNFWGACNPQEPKNRRSRCAALIRTQNTSLVIDTGADFREQMNRENVMKLDGVLYTHQHSDHTHGIDDLRPYYFRNGKKPLNTYGKLNALDEISRRFQFLYDGGNNEEYYPAMLSAVPFDDNQYGHKHLIGDIPFIPFEMDHGTCVSLGFRFGNLSYCTDMKSLDENALNIIKGSDIWIVDAAGYKNPDNAVHADLSTIYRYNEYLQAKEVYITSLSSQMDYETLISELPAGIMPAYDGLKLFVDLAR